MNCDLMDVLMNRINLNKKTWNKEIESESEKNGIECIH